LPRVNVGGAFFYDLTDSNIANAELSVVHGDSAARSLFKRGRGNHCGSQEMFDPCAFKAPSEIYVSRLGGADF
jgi:hypothetical protein